MVEEPERSCVGDHPRGATDPEWDLFVRDDTDDALRYVGTVTAPDVDIAYQQATKLFAWVADDIWLCRSRDIHRYSTHDLDAAATPAPIDSTEESRHTQ